jgi:hypothetical protein
MQRLLASIFVVCLLAGAAGAHAQAVYAASRRGTQITVGGIGSLFQPDFQGDWTATAPYYPVAHSAQYPLIGIGAYVDFKKSRWIQFEAEGRWLRWNQYHQIDQDVYQIGPRIPIHRFGRFTPYGKALVGTAKMRFDQLGHTGSFTDLAFGGGVDVRVSRRFSLRMADVEYQYWPRWGTSTISPYGVSVGVGYRVY